MQRLAWKRHGFRSGLQDLRNGPTVLLVIGRPAHIAAALPLPPAAVMLQVLETLRITP
jgi:hypothetical protein